MKILPRGFYRNNTVFVAKKLLGKKIIRKIGNSTLSGIITETEAYGEHDDPASHAFRGITPRNQAMFGKVGCTYVYFTYGMHYCVNAVAYSPKKKAGAVLIRSVIPEDGIEIMLKNRDGVKISQLTNGPAKLTQAMNITELQYGCDLTKKSDLFIIDNEFKSKILSDKRIGISVGTEKRWNFKLKI